MPTARPDPRKNVLPTGKIEIHKVKLHNDPELDHCWVPFVNSKPIEFEPPCTSVLAAKEAMADEYRCEIEDLRFRIVS